MKTGEFIYGLYIEFESERTYFYVGRSGRGLNRSPGVRFKEHQAHARHDTTPVYTFIREELDAWNIPWHEEILCWCDDAYPTEHSEFYWVVKMIRDGHELYNAKNGDAMQAAAEEAAKSDFQINSIADVAKYKAFKAEEKKKSALRLMDRQAAQKASNEVGYGPAFDKNALFSTIKRVETPSKKEEVVPVDNAQEAFDAGKYQMALNYLGGSYIRFAERFGVTYHECIQ